MFRIAAPVCTLLALLLPAAARAGDVSFHVVAHQDDWQLFFNPKPYDDVVRPMTKVVFVYLTAGDAGNGAGPVENPYYLARESGARRAVRFMADVSSPTGGGSFGSSTIRGHEIAKYLYKNTVSYFLRLPDGGPNGSGFSGTGHVSLEYLRLGEAVNQLSAVDGSATYFGWADLVSTLHALVLTELQNTEATSTWLNFPESSASVNPRDHSDHRNVGRAMDAVASRMTCANVASYVGHSSARMRDNISAPEAANKAAVFAVTVMAIEEMGCSACASTWRHHRIWLGKTYSRKTAGDGSHCFESHCLNCGEARLCARGRCSCPTPRSCRAGDQWDDLTCRCSQ